MILFSIVGAVVERLRLFYAAIFLAGVILGFLIPY